MSMGCNVPTGTVQEVLCGGCLLLSLSSGERTRVANSPAPPAAQMPMGNNMPVGSLKELLSGSDFVTLHVPASKETNNMISRWELMHMRKGRCRAPACELLSSENNVQ